MPIRDFLRKKEKTEENEAHYTAQHSNFDPQPFKIVRSDTQGEELLDSSYYPENNSPQRDARASSRTENVGDSPGKIHKSLSDRLHLTKNKSRPSSSSSFNPPSSLPDIQGAYSGKSDRDETEAKWEERATILANANKSPGQTAGLGLPAKSTSQLNLHDPSGRPRSISNAVSDVTLQEAIRLHETGQLVEATNMFKQLAAEGNVLSEVLYGLALRHGWGCVKDEKGAFIYLASAASDSAALEAEALKAGLKKGGAAKGELVLAIFELGNCYRYGWGTTIDKPAARQYYETAANLGDTDAMNEAGWCYLEGFGGKKDKFKAAQLLRLAEKNGSKTLGNSWIWKDKYNPV